jgi:hypothetical protein
MILCSFFRIQASIYYFTPKYSPGQWLAYPALTRRARMGSILDFLIIALVIFCVDETTGESRVEIIISDTP